VFNIKFRGQRENTPYSSSMPNESDIVSRLSGGKKLKYILKFYIEGSHHVTSRMRNDDLALCQWPNDVWGGISRKPLETKTWVQRTTNRKWTNASPMVTWPMTSCDPDGQGRDPNMLRAQYAKCYRKFVPWNQKVMWPMWLCGPGNGMRQRLDDNRYR